MMLVFAAAATVPVLSRLTGLGGRLPAAAGVLALLVAAAYVVLLVRKPLVRWALSAGIVLLAVVSIVGWVIRDDPSGPVRYGDAQRIFQQQADTDHAGMVLLLLATAALAAGVPALPQFRRPVWPTALACVVALVPVALVANDAAGARDIPFSDPAPAGLWWHLAPGLAATVLAGLTLVLAVSRAERWFLLPVGALLVQVATAHWTWSSAGAWTLARIFGTSARGPSFLEPGLRMQASTTVTLDVDFGAALATAAFLLGPALMALGAARTAHRPAGQPPEPD
jgi:hypothetical protein